MLNNTSVLLIARILRSYEWHFPNDVYKTRNCGQIQLCSTWEREMSQEMKIIYDAEATERTTGCWLKQVFLPVFQFSEREFSSDGKSPISPLFACATHGNDTTVSYELFPTHMTRAGIKRLEMHLPGSEGRINYESTGIFSPDGEYLPFVAPILTEGRPEEWLNTVEASMFQTTKKHLYKALEDSKSKLEP